MRQVPMLHSEKKEQRFYYLAKGQWHKKNTVYENQNQTAITLFNPASNLQSWYKF